ncbi:unnamed protein product [Peniophora sp. CBMAI 1063]|nr:unnamed protein product [Peniophora sp. CBMAI 1063]
MSSAQGTITCERTRGVDATLLIPDDILFKALWIAAFSNPPRGVLLPYHGRDSFAYGLRSVCRRWNCVLVSNPAFWASLVAVASNEDAFDLFRQRSKGHLLDISTSGNVSLARVVEALPRARSLEVSRDDTRTQWNGILNKTAAFPNLKIIRLDRPHLRDFPHFELRINLPNAIECSIDCKASLLAPRLQSLCLTDVYGDGLYFAEMLRGLRSLETLEILSPWTSRAYDWTSLLQGLSGSNLETLVVNARGRIPRAEATPVQLPRLSVFKTTVPLLATSSSRCTFSCRGLMWAAFLLMASGAGNDVSCDAWDLAGVVEYGKEMEHIEGSASGTHVKALAYHTPIDAAFLAALPFLNVQGMRELRVTVEAPFEVTKAVQCHCDVPVQDQRKYVAVESRLKALAAFIFSQCEDGATVTLRVEGVDSGLGVVVNASASATIPKAGAQDKLSIGTSIDDLPVECLHAIFEVYQQLCPAGRYNEDRDTVGMGWVIIGHVCSRWRRVVLGSQGIWARAVTQFYSISAVNTFVERAGGSALCIDMETLRQGWRMRPDRHGVKERVLRPELLSRACEFVNLAWDDYHPHYVPSLHVIISSITFMEMTRLEVAIPHQRRVTRPINAPRLRHLSIRSNAGDMASCPMTGRVLIATLDAAPDIRCISLHRCIDTTEFGREVVEDRPCDTRRVLQEVNLGCFDEMLVKLITTSFYVDDSSRVAIELYGVQDLAAAVHLSTEAFDVPRQSVESIEIRYKHDSAVDDTRLTEIYSYYYLAFTAYMSSGLRIAFRALDEEPSWTWDAFAKAFPCATARSLELSCDTKRDDPDLHEFVNNGVQGVIAGMHEVETVVVQHRALLDFVRHLAPDAPLRDITVAITFHDELEEVMELRNWLLSRQDIRRTNVHLQGSISTIQRPERYRQYEAHVMAKIRDLCNVYDTRKLLRPRIVRDDIS